MIICAWESLSAAHSLPHSRTWSYIHYDEDKMHHELKIKTCFFYQSGDILDADWCPRPPCAKAALLFLIATLSRALEFRSQHLSSLTYHFCLKMGWRTSLTAFSLFTSFSLSFLSSPFLQTGQRDLEDRRRHSANEQRSSSYNHCLSSRGTPLSSSSWLKPFGTLIDIFMVSQQVSIFSSLLCRWVS